MQPILDVARTLGLESEHLFPYGSFAAKVDPVVLEGPRKRDGQPRLVLVSAITPTAAGEGKTTTTIGLGDAFTRLGKSVCLALREPSLGPCFGMKGGGTGGGRSCVVPSDRINLHFTGDFHAVTAAHNLLAAILDNHLHFGNELGLEARGIVWPRVIDMNDRALRDVVLGLGGRTHGVPRESRFEITAASELMAMLCLAENVEDLRARIERTVVAYNRERDVITVREVGAAGAMLALLRDALMPNLVQTMEGTPVLMHGGPFANIAHGCNSVLATKTALHQADWVLTEAGFGFDLGAEKFFDIKCRSAGLDTAAVVLVASVRALKVHGGRKPDELDQADPSAVEAGLPNLAKHIESINHFGERPIVALNRFAGDTDEEVGVVRRWCEEQGVPFAVATHFADGGEGALELARVVLEEAEHHSDPYRPLYELEDSVAEKIHAVATAMYGARDVEFTRAAERDLHEIERLGYADLPVCIAKTHSSLSDDPKLRGRPHDFELTVRNIELNAGAGFLVVLTGDILRMPGLPRRPLALDFDLVAGEIVGLR
ncbi:MAG: formate--tetrahydrofolate ligase [Planctomycetota bacterium]|nr:MAG: formate--tetrahydrofolate ligase [Planctomycetota bacterium]